MTNYDDLDKTYEKYIKAAAVRDALKELYLENKDDFDEHAALVVGGAYMRSMEDFGQAGADYHRLREQIEQREGADSELDLYRAEQAEQRGFAG